MSNKRTYKRGDTIELGTFTIRIGVDHVICDVSDAVTGDMMICDSVGEAYERIAVRLEGRLKSAESHVEVLQKERARMVNRHNLGVVAAAYQPGYGRQS